MSKCFWCRKEFEKGITMDKKEFCSGKCVSEYKAKTKELSNDSNTCEFC
ncbi:MAG: hypothetical protein NUV57_01285 [archaeon]|nr:hypothetical protein [archaeon]